MAFTVRATAIVPKGFDVDKVRREVGKVLIEEGKNDRLQFNKTVEAWTGETPAMVYETKITSNEASVWIGPKGPGWSVTKWTQIDEGTEPHPIASNTWMIFPFQGRGRSYVPKTRPLWLGSHSGGGVKLGPITKTKLVKSHSIEPRYWSRSLAAQRIGPFAEAVQDAVNRGMKP